MYHLFVSEIDDTYYDLNFDIRPPDVLMAVGCSYRGCLCSHDSYYGYYCVPVYTIYRIDDCRCPCIDCSYFALYRNYNNCDTHYCYWSCDDRMSWGLGR